MNRILVFGSVNIDHTYEVPHIVARRFPAPPTVQPGAAKVLTRPLLWPGQGLIPSWLPRWRRRIALLWQSSASRCIWTSPGFTRFLALPDMP